MALVAPFRRPLVCLGYGRSLVSCHGVFPVISRVDVAPLVATEGASRAVKIVVYVAVVCVRLLACRP